MEPIQNKLMKLTQNLWWTWNPEVRAIFRDLDTDLYNRAHRNPLRVIKSIEQALLETRAADADIVIRTDRALRQLSDYLNPTTTWGLVHGGALNARPVAYFCAEFGIHECLPIYSGGLGILAGDHLKGASNLGIPLIGVGLLYHQGYTTQELDRTHWQQDVREPYELEDLPITVAKGFNGEPLSVPVELPGRTIYAKVLEVPVGRVRLILLDTRDPRNSAEDQGLAARLYGGDQRMRIQQELLLGVGGSRALRALGINASVYHLNEGHSAFAILERAMWRVQNDGLEPRNALRETAQATIFTTHTPVDAGHDRFPSALAAEHLGPIANGLKLPIEDVLGFGRVNPKDQDSPFMPTVLALKFSRRANGVAALHGVVSRRMWHCMWPDKAETEVPIGHITNGVHVPTWLAAEIDQLYRTYFGPKWADSIVRPDMWTEIEHIDPAELWEVKQVLKARLIRFVRGKVNEKATRLGIPPPETPPLDPDALTIGFARRFVPYKRPDLLFRDLDRLDRLINHPTMPINLIFAGRSHPADNPGKEIIKRVCQIIEDHRFKNRIVFVENYNMNVGRNLYQGVDAWLNNPRRPLEACGTSGMKAVMNGALHISILDGWWVEGYDGQNGFAIGNGEIHANQDIQDQRDSEALYKLLEEVVVPMYYQRNAQGIPLAWIQRMKRSIRTLSWRFNADRMLIDYARNCYLPASCSNTAQMPTP
ncbi:MAG: alpha-glucan family phosphorylase [Holophagales bacterium]|jgi:starch phosphorylase|nr:alpha-glucan family phosphorylase [Holophagales bacterium]